ncbi:MAG TPA: DNA polymerase III subunit alpha [Erysipelotrichaceae bacterium]|nr:DNA polymerase III subunit alpha [Erysipelotrichaceae bacterium]HQA85305.1 DNA polymerase III subunit alpha [Erysipelotrichaceae bacterium]
MSILLYNRSCYSLLQSTIRVNDLVDFALENGLKSIGICENRNLFSAKEFFKECKKANIKPILGCEIPFNAEEKQFDALIYPKNIKGYIDLIDIITFNRVLSLNNMLDLSENSNVVIKSDSYFSYLLNENDIGTLNSLIDKLTNYENVYVSSLAKNKAINNKINEIVLPICKNYNVKTIALDIALYKDEQDYDAYKALQAIDKATNINDTNLSLVTDASLKSATAMKILFDSESLNNIDLFVNNINLDLDNLKTKLPTFNNDYSINNKEYLKQLCLAGLQKRLLNNISPKYLNRLLSELDVICSMNFEDYFLIVYDIILFCKRNNILAGPGRGSAVGSLVCYCLGITHIDPVKYDLLFERFLNHERVTMPDIDMDFPDSKRNQAIEYVKNKYGVLNVSNIITFGSLTTKALLRDLGKVLLIPQGDLDIVLQTIRNDKLTLKEQYEKNNRFKTAINSSNKLQELYSIGCTLYDLPKNISTHASGILISENKLTEVIPLIMTNDTNIAGYTMEHLENMGLIKFDFLGLKNLSIVEEILSSIKHEIDIYKIDLTDERVYKMLSSGDSSGIFQLESKGMRNTLQKVKPTNFEQLATVIALYRPGPMEFIDQYIINKNNPENIEYLHKDLKPILSNTYGIMIYQEQIMQIAVKLAGFTMTKADLLRSAVSKKSSEQLIGLKNEFIEGCINNNYSKEIAENIYENIYKFANYGFNKSHAIGYGFLAYIMTYLKANFPLQFYCALLNSKLGSNENINYLIECKMRKIKVILPNINESCDKFIVKDNAIMFPFNQIKSISNLTSKTIINDRNVKGKYQNFIDFVSRMYLLNINEKNIEILIRSGCLDSFNLSHKSMLSAIDDVISYVKLCTYEEKGEKKLDLSLVSPPLITNYEDNITETLEDQQTYLGLFLDSHPIEKYRLDYKNTVPSVIAKNINGDMSLIVTIMKYRPQTTRTNDLMCFATCYDEYGTIDLVFMPDKYLLYKEFIKKGIIVLVRGKKNPGRDSVLVRELLVLKG